ncbi:MAG: ComF family protein [Ruminococcaceae bacterium]|nr:ComF family protein [Oscillospiraceae bacterium]
MKKRSVRRFLWYLAAVPRCAVCGCLLGAAEVMRGYSGSDVLCPECRAEWEREKLTLCDACGLPAVDCRCMPTALRKAGAETLICLGDYSAEGAVGRMILRLKKIRLRRAAAFAAAQLSPGIKRALVMGNSSPDILTVTWTPRTKKAKRKYGHDQAELLARTLADELGCACLSLILRCRENKEQKMLGAEERMENVQKVFAVNPKFSAAGKTILLVDDVVTSGASLGQACALLLTAGAERVLCAAPGRSRSRKNQK